LAILFNNQGLVKNEFRAGLALVRVMESSVTAIVYYQLGLFMLESRDVLLTFIPSVVIGIPLGAYLLRGVEAETFRRICMSFDAWVVGFGLSRVLMELNLMASPWAYGVMLATIVADGCLLYVFFKARRAPLPRSDAAPAPPRRAPVSARRPWRGRHRERGGRGTRFAAPHRSRRAARRAVQRHHPVPRAVDLFGRADLSPQERPAVAGRLGARRAPAHRHRAAVLRARRLVGGRLAARPRRRPFDARARAPPAGAGLRGHDPALPGHQVHRAAPRPRHRPARPLAGAAAAGRLPRLRPALLHAHEPADVVAPLVSRLSFSRLDPAAAAGAEPGAIQAARRDASCADRLSAGARVRGAARRLRRLLAVPARSAHRLDQLRLVRALLRDRGRPRRVARLRDAPRRRGMAHARADAARLCGRRRLRPPDGGPRPRRVGRVWAH